MAKPTMGGKIVRDLCRKHPEMPSLTLAKMIYAKHPAVFKNVEAVRGFVREARGNKGPRHRKESADKSLHRPSGKPEPPKMPASKAEDWVPFTMPGKCILVMGDTHVPYHDVRAIETAIRHAKDNFPIDAVLLNGDIADMHSISRWERAPSENDLRGEVNAVRQFLQHIAAEFPRKPIVYKMGNHEERMEKYFWTKAPELFGLPQMRLENLLRIDDDMEPIKAIQKMQFVGDQRPIMAGKLPVLHGHELPGGGGVNPARGAFLRMVASVLINHLHRSSTHTERTFDERIITCRSIGCLCHLHPRYARINKWDQGFATVKVSKDKQYDVHAFKMLGKSYDVRPA